MLVLVVVLGVLAALVIWLMIGAALAERQLQRDLHLAERARIEAEVRRAERQVHDIARRGLQAMLDEARLHNVRRMR
jgi:uncharacterized protein YneF (UPF0154 family)